jgi:hypothetical protein
MDTLHLSSEAQSASPVGTSISIYLSQASRAMAVERLMPLQQPTAFLVLEVPSAVSSSCGLLQPLAENAAFSLER